MFDIWFMEEVQRHKGSEDPNIRLQAYLASLIVYNTQQEEFKFENNRFRVTQERLENRRKWKIWGDEKQRTRFCIFKNDKLFAERIIEVYPLNAKEQLVSELLSWAFWFNLC